MYKKTINNRNLSRSRQVLLRPLSFLKYDQVQASSEMETYLIPIRSKLNHQDLT